MATVIPRIRKQGINTAKECFWWTKRNSEHLAEAIQWKRQTDQSIRQILEALQAGYSPKYYAYLGPECKDDSRYLKNNSLIHKANGIGATVLHDKLAIYSIFSDYSEHFPTLYGTIHEGVYYPDTDTDANSLRDAVENNGEVVIKPVARAGGRGVRKITYDGQFSVNGQQFSPAAIDDLESSLGEDYLVTECLRQGGFASEIFPSSVNSIRLLTAIEPETGEPRAIRAVHRFGTSKSEPTDNWENGGIAVPISNDGKLQQGIVLDENGRRTTIDIHPETGAQLTGIVLPMWDEVQSLAREAALSYPVARLIGWDFAITDDGVKILEASGHPGTPMLQLTGGLLDDPVVKGIIEKDR